MLAIGPPYLVIKDTFIINANPKRVKTKKLPCLAIFILLGAIVWDVIYGELVEPELTWKIFMGSKDIFICLI